MDAGDQTAQRDLKAGRDYPRTYRDFVKMFPDEEACATYLPRAIALAKRVQLPGVWHDGHALAPISGPFGVRGVPSSGIGHSRHDPRQDTNTAVDMV
jgi:hypothetical protein